MPSYEELRILQALPLEVKILKSKERIREFYQRFDGKVYVSFSAGKDSLVVADLVHSMYPEVPLVFANTGLEFPESQKFAKEMGAEFIYPEKKFPEIIKLYGYPIISKEISEAIMYARRIINGSKVYKHNKVTYNKRRELLGERCFNSDNKGDKASSRFNKVKWLLAAQETDFLIGSHCCFYMKKSIFGRYHRNRNLYQIVGTVAEESIMRTSAWLKSGCNVYEGKYISSRPISFWREQDVLEYIYEHKLVMNPVYGDITVNKSKDLTDYSLSQHKRTGCIYCGYGMHMTPANCQTKFQMLAKTHPRQYEYCLKGGQWIDNPHYDPTAPKMDGAWKNWNPKKIWVPSKEGIGLKKVFDDMNAIYGEKFYRYEE